ncbi:MAG: peroxiredoxin, partial [Candidatus Paceibacterota bacterium]
MLQVGQTAPEFSLLDQHGKPQSLADYAGQTILLYFYPKDDTPGCTKEACTIAEVFNEFENLGVKVFGVSADSVESHKAFAEKYSLPFLLLSDADYSTVKAYGAYKEGDGPEHSPQIARVSYLISPDKVIIRAYPEVDP